MLLAPCENLSHGADPVSFSLSETHGWILDADKPSIVVPLEGAEALFRTAKFIEVDVAEVFNPHRYALAFEVTFRSKNGVTETLGNFSLYPADRPGRFIVPTQGKLSAGGAVELLMQLLDKRAPDAPVHVKIRAINALQGTPARALGRGSRGLPQR